MPNTLTLATYGLVRGDGVQSSRAEPNTSAAAAAHQSNMASKSRARAAQFLQAELAPPIMTVQAMSLDRHLSNRYVPNQVPFATLSCGEYLTVQDVQSLACLFDKYNILPNNRLAELVNDPDVFNVASDDGRECTRTDSVGAGELVPSSHTAHAPPLRGANNGVKPPTSPHATTTTTKLDHTAARSSLQQQPGAAHSTAAPATSSSSPSALAWSDAGKMSYASRKDAARVLETKLTRDEDDRALSVEWVVELMLDIVAKRMDAKELERDGHARADTLSGRSSSAARADGIVGSDQENGEDAEPTGGPERRAAKQHPRSRPTSSLSKGALESQVQLQQGQQQQLREQQRATKLRAYRAELMAWIAPLAQTCDVRRQSSVVDGCRRQQQMLIQYQRSVLEMELLRAKRRIESMPHDTSSVLSLLPTHLATTNTDASLGDGDNNTNNGSRTGKGFRHGTGPSQPSSNAITSVRGLPPALCDASADAPYGVAQQTPHHTKNDSGRSSSRRSPATINFRGPFALLEPIPATNGTTTRPSSRLRRSCRADHAPNDRNLDSDADDASCAGDKVVLTTSGTQHAEKQPHSFRTHSPVDSPINSPLSPYRGGRGAGAMGRSAVARAALDGLLPPPVSGPARSGDHGHTHDAATTPPATVTGTSPTSPNDDRSAATDFFLPACYTHASARLALEKRAAEEAKAAAEAKRLVGLSASLATVGSVGVYDSDSDKEDEVDTTRPPSMSSRAGVRAGVVPSSSSPRARPMSANVTTPTVSLAAAAASSIRPADEEDGALTLPRPPVLECGQTWIEALADLPAWSAAIHRYLDHERCALGTQTLEDAVLSLAHPHTAPLHSRHAQTSTLSATSTHNHSHSHTAADHSSVNAISGTSSLVRVQSFRRSPGYTRLAQLPRVNRDAPCRVVCWTDLSNNFILDYGGDDHRGGFLEQTYVRGPSMMLEGDDANHSQDATASATATTGGSEGANSDGDDDDDNDENSEEALLSTIHGGARRRRLAVGRGASSADEPSRNAAAMMDVATFAEELKGLHRQSADHMVVTANGALIITSSKDGIVKSWDGRFGRFRTNVLNVGSSWVLAMTLVRDDQILLVATSNAELTLVELSTGHVIHKYRGCMSLLTALRMVEQPDAQHTAKYGMKPGACGPHRVSFERGTSAEGYHVLREREVDLTRQAVTVPVQSVEGFVSPTAFYFCEETFLGFFGTTEGVIGCMDLSNELRHAASLVTKGLQPLSLLFSARAHAAGTTITGLCFSPSTGCVVSAGQDGSVTRTPFARDSQSSQYIVGTPAPVPVFQPKPIRFLVFHPQARLAATSHSDRRVQLWSLTRTSVELIHQFPQETHDIVSVVFLPREDRIAMLLTDHSLRVFDVRGYRPSAIITTRANGDQQLLDMASVTLKLSSSDADGCVGYHAGSRRLVCALRSPVMYVPSGGPRIEGSKREAETHKGENAVASRTPQKGRNTRQQAPFALGAARHDPGREGDDDEEDDDEEENDVTSHGGGSSDRDTTDELTALKTLQRMSLASQREGQEVSGLLARRASLEVVEMVESRQQARAAARAAKRRRMEAQALLVRRLAPHTTHHRGGVMSVVVVPDRLEVHSFTSDRWKVWSMETGALTREMEVPREVRLAFPRFRRTNFVCAHWSTATRARLLLGGCDGVLTTLDPDTGVIVMTEQLNLPSVTASPPIARGAHSHANAAPGAVTAPTTTTGDRVLTTHNNSPAVTAAMSVHPATAAPTRPLGDAAAAAHAKKRRGGADATPHPAATTTTAIPTAQHAAEHATLNSHEVTAGVASAYLNADKDITVLTCEKQRAFLCAGRHCVVRGYRPNVLDAHGAEVFTSLTLSLPLHLNTSITACCVVRDTHVCLGTTDGHLLFYRLVDQSAPYAEEVLKESYPDGDPDIGSVIGLFFLNEKNQGLVVVVTSLGVMHVYAYLKGTFVGRLRLVRGHECHLSAVYFARHSSLLVVADSLGRVRLFDLTAFISDVTNFKRALRLCGTFQGATSEVTALTVLTRHAYVLPSSATAAAAGDSYTSQPCNAQQNRLSMGGSMSSTVPLWATSAATAGVTMPSPPMWLLVGSSDGNMRLFWWDPTSMRGVPTAMAQSLTGTTEQAQISLVTRASTTVAEGLDNGSFAGDAASLGANANQNGGGSGTSPKSRMPALVGLFGCDIWSLGDDSTYSVDVTLPVEEVSARQREAQAVLEEVMRGSKPAETNSPNNNSHTAASALAPSTNVVSPTGAAAGTMPVITPTTTTTMTTTTTGPQGAPPLAGISAAQSVGSTHHTQKKPVRAVATQSSPTIPSAGAAATTMNNGVPSISRTVHSLLPSSKTMNSIHDDKAAMSAVRPVEAGEDAGTDSSLPPSAALGSRRAQAGRVPIDASPQRRISPPTLSLNNGSSHGESGVTPSQSALDAPPSRRAATAIAIASVLCGDDAMSEEDSCGGSSMQSTRTGTTRSRHETLLLEVISAMPSNVSSSADANYAAAHQHMSVSTPNPLLRTYPVAILRKLGVVLPNQVVLDGGDEAVLPADVAFDPVRMRAYLQAEQRGSISDVSDQPPPPASELPWQERGAVTGNTNRARRLTAVMNPSASEDAGGAYPSFFLTDVPSAETGTAHDRVSSPYPDDDSSPRASSAAMSDQAVRTGRDSDRPAHDNTQTVCMSLSATPSIPRSMTTASATAHSSFHSTLTPPNVVSADPLAHTRAADTLADVASGSGVVTPPATSATPVAGHCKGGASGLPPRATESATPSAGLPARDGGEQEERRHTPHLAATTGALGLASLPQTNRVVPCAMRAASASSPRPHSHLPGSATAISPSRMNRLDTVAAVGRGGAVTAAGGDGADESLQTPLGLSFGERGRLACMTGTSASAAVMGSPLSAHPVGNSAHGASTGTLCSSKTHSPYEAKRREAETVAFPDGLPPMAVLEERRDQLMLAHLARQLDHLQPSGSEDGAYMSAIEKAWRRRRGDAATRAAATGAGASSGPDAAFANSTGDAGESSYAGEKKSPSHGGSTGVERGVGAAKSRGARRSARPAARAASSATLGVLGHGHTNRSVAGAPTLRCGPGDGGGFAGLDLTLLAHPTEVSAATSGGHASSTSTTTSAAALLPAHERMQQHIQRMHRADLQALRDRLAARGEQEAQQRSQRRPDARSPTTDTAAAALSPSATSTSATAPARPLPRARDELPLISGRQRLEAIDVALPSTLTRDEGAKLQLRQLKAICGAGNHAPAELSSSAPGPHRAHR